MAQTQTSTNIAVKCQAADQVSPQKLSELCTDLHLALTAKYPDASFAVTKVASDDAPLVIVFDAFVANRSGIVASLGWQATGKGSYDGPKMGFSIVDKELTPDMQMKFLTRLVQNTEFPL